MALAAYIIRDTNDGMMLQVIGVSKVYSQTKQIIKWTAFPGDALHLNYEEAQAVVQFIRDVIDWELAEQLEVTELKNS